MSYIHCYDDNYYKPGENLTRLFEDLVVRPFEEHPSPQPWVEKVVNTDHTYHREEILQQGGANFSEGFNGLLPKDMVLLYCVYYLPMHLFSSYHIFRKHLTPVSDKVIFIDFGCGPLTSGIAFWAAFAGQRDITYIGIDKSEAMLNKAREINRYEDPPFFKGKPLSNCNQLHESLDQYITVGDQTQIIFNFCYSLARDTLDTENLSTENLSNVLIEIVEKYKQHKMFVIYQNPPIPEGFTLETSYLHKNWYFLKTQLSTFHSQITQSNTEQFRYDNLIDGLPHTLSFYFDILSYEPSVVSNDPLELSSIF